MEYFPTKNIFSLFFLRLFFIFNMSNIYVDEQMIVTNTIINVLNKCVSIYYWDGKKIQISGDLNHVVEPGDVAEHPMTTQVKQHF